MRAKGKEKVKEFKGGVVKQREKLNTLSGDHCDLVDDVRALAKRQEAQGDTERIIIVDLGTQNEEVEFVYFDAVGTIAGTVAAIDAAESA